ncbi:MAG: GNAT family N-acetyltransferase [Pseudomonadota bacterium]
MVYNIKKISRNANVDAIAILFDNYRQFYRQDSDITGARAYLKERIDRQQSVIFVAYDEHQRLIGFAQLYPMFSSVAMKKHWLLNDLYITDTHRRQGVAKQLLDAVHKFARQDGADRVALKTEKHNAIAKQLYEKLGYQFDKIFDHYTLQL